MIEAEEDMLAATDALAAWADSQGLSAQETVAVLMCTVSRIVGASFRHHKAAYRREIERIVRSLREAADLK